MDVDRSLYETVGSSRPQESYPPPAHCAPNQPFDHHFQPGAASSCWAQSDNAFYGVAKAHESIPPGMYRCELSDRVGPVFLKQRIDLDGVVHLPDSASDEVLREVRAFRGMKERFREHGFMFKRGIMLWGPAGCHAVGQRVIMANGDFKRVEDVSVGDQLLGPDGLPRNVLKLCRGRDEMVRIVPKKGEPFVVNMNHILALAPCGPSSAIKTPINLSVANWLKQSHTQRWALKLYRSPVQEFAEKDLPIPPYILGLWLGDGHTKVPAVTTMDEEIATAWTEWGKALGLKVYRYAPPFNRSATYRLTTGAGGNHGQNHALNLLRQIGVYGNKHIPLAYRTASVEQRRALLAGLLDTDGYCHNGVAEYSSKLKILADDVAYLARSLGLSAYVYKRRKGTKVNGKDVQRDYFLVSISGDLDQIPTRLSRRLFKRRAQIKNHRHVSFAVEALGEGDYYGFILDGDHLYLLDDFTVTHNSGKTVCVHQICQLIVQEEGGVAILVDVPHAAAQCLQLLRRIEPDRPVVAIFEDLDALVQRFGENEYLALLDGEAQVDNICFISTTNYPEVLDARFVDRPSRFDTVKYIGMPSREAREVFLQAKAPALVNGQLEAYVEASEGFSLAHLKELVVLTQCFEYPLAEAAARLKKMQMKPSSERAPHRSNAGFGLAAAARHGTQRRAPF